MVLKNVFAGTASAVLVAWSGIALGDEYRAEQFLGLDLSNALLSPKPLGPPAAFVRLPVQAKADRESEEAPRSREGIKQQKVRLGQVPHAKLGMIHAAHPRTAAPNVRREEPVAITNVRPRRHPNPLDAQAFDTRIQVWPCTSGGGVCDWKR
jgi:hypothetical protein